MGKIKRTSTEVSINNEVDKNDERTRVVLTTKNGFEARGRAVNIFN